MIYMSKNKYETQMQKIKRDNISRQRRRNLMRERFRYFPRFNMPPTSKIALWAGFILFAEIIIFCQYIAIKTYDTSPLVAMIGAIGGWISMFYSYNRKSTVENSRNGIVFETAMLAQQKANDTTSEEAVG